MEVNYIEGKKNGFRTTYQGDEATKEFFENDVKQGPTLVLFANGSIKMKTPFVNGLEEGIAREFVNRIQNIRKTKDFNITDKIVVTLQNHTAITSAVEAFSDYICNETLAVDLKLAENVSGETIDLTDEVSLEIQVELNQ